MVEIRRLGPSEIVPFLDFMDGPAFTSQPQWQGCYCQEYLNTASENEVATPESNRSSACERISSGTMQGYLAFEQSAEGERAIGWMAANSHNNFRLLPTGEDDVATIVCISVQADRQSQGVASALLDYALGDLPLHGYKKVQAAPLAS